MLMACVLIVVGLALLVGGGEALLRGAVGLATLLRLSPAVIGLTVVAAGTSVPELAVSASAAFQGTVDLAVANVVGSNIFNILAILGLCALIRPLPIQGNTIRLEYPVLVLVTLLSLVVAQDGSINRLDATLMLAIYVGFTAYLVGLVRTQVTAVEAREISAEIRELTPAATEAGKPKPWIAVALVAGGVVLLALGAHWTVQGAVTLARMIGWSERLIGLTIVAAGTSLPEVMASVMSSVRGRSDIAIGNVIGSNLFNILIILGSTAMAKDLPVQAALFSFDCWWMLAATLLLFPVMRSGFRIARWEGALLLGVYGFYLTQLIRG
jgi:cation:H+ antiporter